MLFRSRAYYRRLARVDQLEKEFRSTFVSVCVCVFSFSNFEGQKRDASKVNFWHPFRAFLHPSICHWLVQ